MKTCSLNDFMDELTPWLDSEHIRRAAIDDKGRLVLFFMDGMKNVYQIDDCSVAQVKKVLDDLGKKGISLEG